MFIRQSLSLLPPEKVFLSAHLGIAASGEGVFIRPFPALLPPVKVCLSGEGSSYFNLYGLESLRLPVYIHFVINLNLLRCSSFNVILKVFCTDTLTESKASTRPE